MSIGQMMAVVAACAALSGSPYPYLGQVLVVGVFLLPLVWLATVIGNQLGEARIMTLALTTGGFIAWVVMLAIQTAGFEIFVFILTIVSGLGLFVVVDRHFHRKPLASGHLIWALSGWVWIALPFTQLHRGRGSFIQYLSDSARLLLAAAILLIAFARRPTGAEDRRTHWAGWLVVECDVILWGWLAWQYTHST